MSEIEFIDLFSEDAEAVPQSSESSFETSPFYSQSTAADSPEEAAKPRSRVKLSDYKHQAHHLNKGSARQAFSDQTQRIQAVSEENNDGNGFSLKMSDDKMVWAGALFVFFGVFVFIFGYWLGNMTVSNLKVDHQRYEMQIKEKLAEKKLENRSLTPLKPLSEKANVEEIKSVPSVTPKVTAEEELPIEKVIRPRTGVSEVKPALTAVASKPKEIQKTVAKKSKTVVKSEKLNKTKTSAIAPKPGTVSTSGKDYTIQVSAYTQMDKARALEDLLRNKGLQAYIVESMVNGNRYFRVRVGKFNGKAAAAAALKKIKLNRIAKDSYLIRLK